MLIPPPSDGTPLPSSHEWERLGINWNTRGKRSFFYSFLKLLLLIIITTTTTKFSLLSQASCPASQITAPISWLLCSQPGAECYLPPPWWQQSPPMAWLQQQGGRNSRENIHMLHTKDRQGSNGPQSDTWVWRKIGSNEWCTLCPWALLTSPTF